MIFPFVWMILTSFQDPVSESNGRFRRTILPSSWSLDNFVQAHWKACPSSTCTSTPACMILFRVVCAVVFSSMAGYAFAKLQFPGQEHLLFGIVLIQMMLPSQIFITPQYQMLAQLGLTNTIFALVFPGLVSAFGTFFLRQAYLGIPNEIAEAAYLDGCNQWQTFTKVMFPLTGLQRGRPGHLHRRVRLLPT